MTEVISVRFKDKGKIYFFDSNSITVCRGDDVIVETAKGLEFAECVTENHLVDDSCLVLPLRPVIRIATENDHNVALENIKKEKVAFNFCQKKIVEHELDMKLVEVEYSFDGSKVIFFFTSDGRVDFRELVKDLAAQFHTRIELRQIGVRDEAKMLGGLGICGRPFCCHQFLDDFQPVSIKMAKTQSLSLNPTKISGTCGRLMCCLKYEQFAYEEAVKTMPPPDSFVETPDGQGTIVESNILRQTVKVKFETGPYAPDVKVYPAASITVIKSGKAHKQDLDEEKHEEVVLQQENQPSSETAAPNKQSNVVKPHLKPKQRPKAISIDEFVSPENISVEGTTKKTFRKKRYYKSSGKKGSSSNDSNN